ncbi:hypothetical protein PV646_28580 [Streptomyces sp. ID05-26A]|nr:hypothetical protein [Streptomyces sp. ID05-26A]
MPKQPEISVHFVPHGHEIPEWRHVVHVHTGQSLVAPMAACRSPHRAEIVAEALRRLAETDPTFADRVVDATLAERRDGAKNS